MGDVIRFDKHPKNINREDALKEILGDRKIEKLFCFVAFEDDPNHMEFYSTMMEDKDIVYYMNVILNAYSSQMYDYIDE